MITFVAIGEAAFILWILWLAFMRKPAIAAITKEICKCAGEHRVVIHSLANRFALHCASCGGHCGDCDSVIVTMKEHAKED